MPRFRCQRGWGLGALVVIAALGLTGANPLAKGKRKEGPPPKIEENVASLAYIAAGKEIKVEGVGLVAGLDNTGVDPPPSYYRSKLLEEMQKAGVANANKYLADPRFAMVIVHLTIQTGVTPSDRLDVELEIPPGSGTTSLAGGYLMQARLREIAVIGGTPKDGPELALAEGPIMIGTEAKPDDPKRGRVLGGGRVKKDIPYNLILKDSRRSFRTSNMLEKVVNARFHQSEGLDQKGMALAKTDQFLVLKVPRSYHHYPGRYFEVVKRLPMVDSPELRAVRIEGWGKQLLDVKTAGAAALCLEGMGPNAIETLKKGLSSDNAQVRFFAAEALAYLNDVAGVDVLADTAIHLPEFRTIAFHAFAALDQPAAHLKLRKLMDEPDIEVRYGAFNALRTLDDRDPFLGQVAVLDEPPADPEAEENLEPTALALRQARLGRNRPKDPFALYLVDSEGPPLVHIARTRRCEVVIFGRNQKLLPPIVLGTGALQLNAGYGDDGVQLSKIVSSRSGEGDQKIQCSLDLGDVVRRMANLGATYPDVVSILQVAQKQKNLPGPLVVDSVPGVNPVLIEAVVKGKDVTKKDSEVKRTSSEEPAPRKGLFQRIPRLFKSSEE